MTSVPPINDVQIWDEFCNNEVFNTLSPGNLLQFESDSSLLLDCPQPDLLRNELDDELELPQFDILNGDENFSLFFHEKANSSFYKYSEFSNKLYCEVDKVVPLMIRAQNYNGLSNYTVRITPYFSSPQYIQDIVSRCSYHFTHDKTFVNGKDKSCNDYFLKLEYPDAQYKTHKKRPSIYSNIKFDSNLTAQLQLKFLCLSSCNGGCNRRDVFVAIEIWDDTCFELRGRLLFNVRVCASPSRDFKNEIRRMKRSLKSPTPQVQQVAVKDETKYILEIYDKELFEKTRKFYEEQLLLSKLKKHPEMIEKLNKN